MGVLPEQKLAVVRHLVEAAPDRVVGDLRAALAGAGEQLGYSLADSLERFGNDF